MKGLRHRLPKNRSQTIRVFDQKLNFFFKGLENWRETEKNLDGKIRGKLEKTQGEVDVNTKKRKEGKLVPSEKLQENCRTTF